MEIRELMTADPEACLATESCTAAVEIMRRRNCGFVPVVDSQATKRLIGVVTDRDIALHLGQAEDEADDVPLKACMTSDVKWIAPSASLSEAAMLMERHAIHRLPVVDEGRLVGVLSLADIARATDARMGFRDWREAEHMVTEIVEAIAAVR